MLNSPVFVPIFIVTLVVFIFLFFRAKDKIQSFFEEKRLTQLKSLTLSQCEACRDYEIWEPGDEIHYKIDKDEVGVADLIIFHPEKVVVKNNNRKLLLDPYLVVRNRSAEERKHIQKGVNYHKALTLNPGENRFLLAERNSNNEEESYGEIS